MSQLLNFFRPEKQIVWQKLSEQLQGEFIPGKGLRRHDLVQIQYEHWTILLDTVKRGKRPTFTRIRALYVNRDSFYFRIFRHGLVHSLRKIAGMQDVVVGYPEFDRNFIIQGNDPVKLKMLFNHSRIRELIAWQPAIFLQSDVDDEWVTDPFREGISELRFQVPGVITDLDRLHALYELFAELLNHLCHIGSAYEDDPYLKFS